jgi:hypothetical protein
MNKILTFMGMLKILHFYIEESLSRDMMSTWSRTVTINAPGLHTIAANVRDNAGNFRTIGINVTIT